MDMSPEFLQKLLSTFQSELEEGLQVITEGLLWLEKNGIGHVDSDKTIEKIFRASHNIKGAAHGVGVTTVGEIAHHMESIFSEIQKKKADFPLETINICFEAVDDMRAAMQSFTDKTPLSFDPVDLLRRLKNYKFQKPEGEKSKKADETHETKTTEPAYREHETIRVQLSSLDRVSALLEEMQVNKISIDDHYSDLTGYSGKTRQLSEIMKKTLMGLKSQLGTGIGDTLSKQYSGSLDVLSEVSNMADELQKNMRPRINELSVLSNSLQEEVRMLRLVPVSSLISTFPRLVRDLAHEVNKTIDFEVTGDEVKIDKLVLEGLKDPLVHLLRNAIDHGIEDPAIRTAAGKSGEGHIRIDIQEEGNQILFYVSDDGAGIEVEKISRIAMEKKIISKIEREGLTDMEVLELIFRPGFSTREMVTSLSGRGVGLDVVKENINRLNGHVNVETIPGQKTVFTLRVPLTLSSERGLMVNTDDQLFVIPVSAVERVLILKPGDIIDVEASQAIRVDKRAVPLRALSDILDLKKIERSVPEKFPIVVVTKGWHVVALLVDDILGEREIVIKPLQAPLVDVRCIAGGTLSGNGQVIIVLNASELIETALHTQKTTRISQQNEQGKSDVVPHILVVDDSITTRTLEKSILESRGYRVTVAVNGNDAWNILQKEKFSLMITDVSMPVMDGFTLTEKVKTSNLFSELPVIIVTSLNSELEKKRGVDVGANAYIVKSEFESGALLEIVSQLV